MKSLLKIAVAITTGMVIFGSVQQLEAQSQWDTERTRLNEVNLGGPRIGLTVVPGSNSLTRRLEEAGIGRLISQFGWHFERTIAPRGGGPAFVIQCIPLIAGVEYGTMIPGATAAVGIRMPTGIEFGMGPNILLGGEKGINPSLIIGIGKTFHYDGVHLPVNFAVSTSPSGQRFTLLIGYAIERSRR